MNALKTYISELRELERIEKESREGPKWFKAERPLIENFPRLLDLLERLVEALEFYAQGAQIIGFDRGEKAREALAELGRKGDET